jgi:hypothetical protein
MKELVSQNEKNVINSFRIINKIRQNVKENGEI